MHRRTDILMDGQTEGQSDSFIPQNLVCGKGMGGGGIIKAQNYHCYSWFPLVFQHKADLTCMRIFYMGIIL